MEDSMEARGPYQGVAPNPQAAVLWMLGILGFLLGVMLFPLLQFEGLPPLAVAAVAALPVMFWIYLAAGLIAWWRRPGNGVGMLLVWAGIGMWSVGVSNTTVPEFRVVNALFPTFYGAFAHLLLAFPAGRLTSILERMLAAGMYFSATILQMPRYLFFGLDAEFPAWKAEGAFDVAQLASVTVFSLAIAAVLMARLARARPEHRHSLSAVYVYGVLGIVFTPLMTWAFDARQLEAEAIRDSIQLIVVATFPVVVLIAFQFGGFRRTAELETLSAWLGETEALRKPIRDALAQALGDPSLSVTYWSAELNSWVGEEGLIAAEPDTKTGRARYEISLNGSPVAAIEYDALLADSREVERAANLAGLALERERLSAELRASRQAVIESRERLVGAADGERRRIGQDLHDGLQARLVFIGIEAQLIATAPEGEVSQRATALRNHIDLAAADLRAIVDALVPPALVTLGVVGALEELAESMPIPTRVDAALSQRLHDSIETTAYLVVAEALTNVVKHSGATHCHVSLRVDAATLHVAVADNGKGRAAPGANSGRSGMGLNGIADRVAALGGVSGMDMLVEGGTTLWARIPCES
jgi:signal transduction histidine kinase